MRGIGHLDIGPLRFSLRCMNGGTMRYAAPAYAGFYAQGSEPCVSTPLSGMPVDLVERISPLPRGEPIWRAGGHWAAWKAGDDLVFRSGIQAPAEAQMACRVARDLSRAELAPAPSAWVGGGCESPLRYPLDQILTWGMLSRIGGALLHAAVAVRDGLGWVFAGRSGAGKSTLAGLCHAEGYRILNDDRALVFPRGGEWRVAGTPWHGSGRFAEAAEVPLGGLFFLNQSPENRLEEMEPAASRLALLDVAAVPWFEDAWAQGTLDGLDRLVREVELQRFHFTRTSAAVQVVGNAQGLRPGVCA